MGLADLSSVWSVITLYLSILAALELLCDGARRDIEVMVTTMKALEPDSLAWFLHTLVQS